MTSPPAEADRLRKPHSSYQHEAFVYRGNEDFLAGTVPFVRDAIVANEPIMVAVSEPRLALLQEAMGDDADRVIFVDMAQLGANPARIIPGWRAFLDEFADRGPVRGIGEPVWAGRRPAEIVECQLHEALLNLAVDPATPLWLRCPYDADALDEAILAEAARSHPAIVDGNDYRGSTGYGGAHHVDTMFRSALPEPLGVSQLRSLTFHDVAELRSIVSQDARRAGVDMARTRDLTVAVTEVATNSVRHGGGSGTLRMWRNSDAFVCEIRDFGQIADPLVGRRLPPLAAEGGRGVWLANQLADLVQLRSTPQGTTVRMLSWL